MRVERGGDEVLGADQFSVARFDADRAAAVDHDARGLRVERNIAAAFAHRGLERARKRRRAAPHHLRLGRARQQRGDVMAEAGQPQVDFAQPVEEEKPGLDRRMLELPFDELERRERAHLQEPPASGRAGKERPAFLRRQRR
jgi:hypothetical protein